MPGLVPGIHVFVPIEQEETWMAGSSPAMTETACSIRFRQKSKFPKPTKTAARVQHSGDFVTV
jgi:hypothetical protein